MDATEPPRAHGRSSRPAHAGDGRSPEARARRRKTLLHTLVHSVAAGAVADPGFGLDLVAGRLAELSGGGSTAVLTAAFALVRDAQRQGEPVAWITTPDSSFFPPDAAAGGIDLESLPVVRVPAPQKGTDATAAARAAVHLVRSGAFGLVVLDLVPLQKPHAPLPSIPLPHQTHLVGLAQRHGTGVVVLTAKSPDTASVGSLVALRLDVRRADKQERGAARERDAVPESTAAPISSTTLRASDGRYEVHGLVTKDKRRGPGRVYRELCHGPAGLR